MTGRSTELSSQEPLRNHICNTMMIDLVFQEDCFELDLVVLPTDIFILPRQKDLTHSNLLVFIYFRRFFRTTPKYIKQPLIYSDCIIPIAPDSV